MLIFYLLLVAFIIFLLYGIYQWMDQSVKAKEEAEKREIEQIRQKEEWERITEEQNRIRGEYVEHYRHSKKVKSFARRISRQICESINNEFNSTQREVYHLEYSIEIYKHKIYYENCQELISTAAKFKRSILFSDENINPIDNVFQRYALADVLGEKVVQALIQLIPNGPDDVKGNYRYEVIDAVKPSYHNSYFSGPIVYLYFDYTNTEYKKSFSDL